jgi:hypothetical protein
VIVSPWIVDGNAIPWKRTGDRIGASPNSLRDGIPVEVPKFKALDELANDFEDEFRALRGKI